MTALEPSHGMNPLWVIAAFLGVAEVTVGIVATQSEGWIQGLLAVFSVAFPVGIAVAFFLILWFRPYVLYAPNDYPDGTRVADFVDAVSVARASRLRSLDAVVQTTIEEVLRDRLPGSAIEESVQAALDIAHESIEKALVFVETGPLREDSPLPKGIAVPAFPHTSVQEFLDELWLGLASVVPAFSYGEKWELVSAHTGQPLPDMGWQWAERQGKKGDDRQLSAIGIKPGIRLRVRLKQRPPLRPSTTR
ncbi:hypothetical protein [Actinokineospora sp. NBRC 105648]|uniref:hypothetical protein n=1 Tax=Actinokineospora sp. NBRC 105648 TaxID=3032206 RepID=UPI0024A2B749|nr:hypothetical protein [Actinokineospora sp. NBRC 105648]GLZ39271.1 hypothetical protein Acsp05_28950 [Actinokineospora sp. NBRC 105648]